MSEWCDNQKKPSGKFRQLLQERIDKAITGDMSAIKEVFDRLDGKVVNQVNAEITDNRPIYVVTGIDNDDNGREDNAIAY